MDRAGGRRVAADKSAIRPHVLRIFLPLACGYLVSYIFRTINGTLSDDLIAAFALDARTLGLLTSVYFLAFVLSALPIGAALDAFGPRRVQAFLMTVAALGALVFALADNLALLLLGRALIGLGVAGALMAALKANALWVARPYLALANGGIVAFGGIGAIAATLPAGVLDADIGWRPIFLILAALSAATAIAVWVFLPGRPAAGDSVRNPNVHGFADVLNDRRFLQLAPLSAAVVGSAFAIQGLWAARWLVDVDGFGPRSVLDELLAMGAGLAAGSLLIGAAATWLRRWGIGEARVFGGFSLTFVAVQLAILANATIPPALLWGAMGAFAGMSVLSYSILDAIFPPGMVGRANSLLNVLHLAGAWLVQAAMGMVIDAWPATSAGHYPVIAYRVAFALPVGLQTLGLMWFFRWSRPGGTAAAAIEGQPP